MAKYIALTGGELVEVVGTTTSAGVADAAKMVQLDSNGKLDTSLMPTGIAADVVIVTASEALTAGNLVNIYDNAGTPNARKADASNNREATGFVLSGVANGGQATVYKEGTIVGLTGLTTGPAFLGVAGAVTNTPPTTAGHISQRVGTAVGATQVDFSAQRKITLA